MENPPRKEDPPRIDEPPPRRRNPPHPGSGLRHTVHDRPVRILLECILVRSKLNGIIDSCSVIAFFRPTKIKSQDAFEFATKIPSAAKYSFYRPWYSFSRVLELNVSVTVGDDEPTTHSVATVRECFYF